MVTKFLFMDDSVTFKDRDDNAQIASLTGMILTAEQCLATRREYLRMISPLFVDKRRDETIISQMPELHGCDMLRNHRDETKLQVFQETSM